MAVNSSQKQKSVAVTARVPGNVFRRLMQEAENTESTYTRIIVRALQDYLGTPCPKCGAPMVEE